MCGRLHSLGSVSTCGELMRDHRERFSLRCTHINTVLERIQVRTSSSSVRCVDGVGGSLAHHEH
jgi:hypothetical protein